MRSRRIWSHRLPVVALGTALYLPGTASASSVTLTPATMTRVAAIEERFQSYNIEMVEVTGGRFWRPYRDGVPPLFAYRKPIDLSNARLRKLAADSPALDASIREFVRHAFDIDRRCRQMA